MVDISIEILDNNKGAVVITLMNKFILEGTSEGAEHVVVGYENQAPALPSVRKLEIIFNALMLALYKRGKGKEESSHKYSNF